MPSLRLVNPFMSQNSTVITRRSPSLAVSDFGSISPSTTRGSTYRPKVSRKRSLWRNCSTMLLNAAVSWPISSCVVTSIDPSSRPASTARVPSSKPRTGVVMPVEMNSENISPRMAASTVRMAEMMMAVCWSRIVTTAVAADLRQHVRADFLDLLAELVAKRIGPGESWP